MQPILLFLHCFLLGVLAVPYKPQGIPNVGPEVLDYLLKNKKYDEFCYLMGIHNSSLAHPEPGDNATFLHPEVLEYGDILEPPPALDEEGRQGLRFDRNPRSKWPGGNVHYTISSSYSASTAQKIRDAIQTWNSKVRCVRFVPRNRESDYVMFFPGRGCYSTIGRTGSQQPLSIQDPGCLRPGTILHEMEHAIGISHEQNRSDRDRFIRILWQNIPQRWRSQFQKVDPNNYGLQRNYDYYSIMHYSINAPETNKPAFQILNRNVDRNYVGQRRTFTNTDLSKISDLYC